MMGSEGTGATTHWTMRSRKSASGPSGPAARARAASASASTFRRTSHRPSPIAALASSASARRVDMRSANHDDDASVKAGAHLRGGRAPPTVVAMRHLGMMLATTALAAAPVLERVEVSGRTEIVVRLTLTAPVAVRSQVPPPRLGQLDRILVDLEGATLGPVTR